MSGDGQNSVSYLPPGLQVLPAERHLQVFFFSRLWYNRIEIIKRPALPDLKAGGAGRIL